MMISMFGTIKVSQLEVSWGTSLASSPTLFHLLSKTSLTFGSTDWKSDLFVVHTHTSTTRHTHEGGITKTLL